MNPSDALARLLAQHEELRALLAEVRGLAGRFRAGEPVTPRFAAGLDALRVAFAAHNDFELSLLEPILRDADAWGPARVARMLEEHGAEHAVFAEFFAGGLDEVAARVDDFAEDIDAHMAAEERTFLSAAVLRDDVITDGGPTG